MKVLIHGIPIGPSSSPKKGSDWVGTRRPYEQHSTLETILRWFCLVAVIAGLFYLFSYLNRPPIELKSSAKRFQDGLRMQSMQTIRWHGRSYNIYYYGSTTDFTEQQRQKEVWLREIENYK